MNLTISVDSADDNHVRYVFANADSEEDKLEFLLSNQDSIGFAAMILQSVDPAFSIILRPDRMIRGNDQDS